MQFDMMEGQRLITMRKFNDSLPGRILTVLLVTLVASGLTYLIYLANRGIVPAVLQWVLVAGIGLATGFSARYFLAGRTYTLQLLTVFLALLIGLVFLGLISRGLLGTQLPTQDQSALNLSWLSQFLLAAVAAWLSLSAWKIAPRSGQASRSRSGSRVRTGTGNASTRTGGSSSRAGTSSSRSTSQVSPAPKVKTPPVLQRDFWQGRLESLQGKLRNWWEKGLPEPSVHSESHTRRPSVKLQARHTRRSTPTPRRAASKRPTAIPVRLIGKEEHRCPYCLEIVVENDPRGVKVCSICHTQHHADCWDVTGTCQVPHYHE